MDILLDFGTFSCRARLFDTAAARAFAKILPCRIQLTTWGRECYGEIPLRVKEEKLVPSLPPGGIAYTSRGNYLCVFYGQTPAWPVEQIGGIEDGEWQKLVSQDVGDLLIVSAR